MFVLVCAAQKQPGDDGFLSPAKKNGKLVIMMPEALVGVLLEMVSGSELTPKGGLEKMLSAHEKHEQLPKPTGKFGSGAYKDERWSLTALRKRVTSVRKFYDLHVEGDKKLVNPGYANMVYATMSSIVLLLGTAPSHVRASGLCGCMSHVRCKACPWEAVEEMKLVRAMTHGVVHACCCCVLCTLGGALGGASRRARSVRHCSSRRSVHWRGRGWEHGRVSMVVT